MARPVRAATRPRSAAAWGSARGPSTSRMQPQRRQVKGWWAARLASKRACGPGISAASPSATSSRRFRYTVPRLTRGSRRRTTRCTHSAVGCDSVPRSTSRMTRRGPVRRRPRARRAVSLFLRMVLICKETIRASLPFCQGAAWLGWLLRPCCLGETFHLRRTDRMAQPLWLRIEGARQNNLKNVSVALPHDRVTVITGVSGSGKSSLAFDTIFAEGQWRYIESLSAYARMFLERLDRPDVDRIEHIRPAIALEQKNPVRTARSTVGTATELHDYLRLLFAKVGRVHCPRCGSEARSDTAERVADELIRDHPGGRALVCFPLPSAPRP